MSFSRSLLGHFIPLLAWTLTLKEKKMKEKKVTVRLCCVVMLREKLFLEDTRDIVKNFHMCLHINLSEVQGRPVHTLIPLI